MIHTVDLFSEQESVKEGHTDTSKVSTGQIG